ncbi:5267_t:CDS:1, partial [Cetraspora pellucida]
QIGEQKSCKRWNNREEIRGSLSRLISKKEEPKLEVEHEMI